MSLDQKMAAWLRAAHLPLYPITLMAYALGAVAGSWPVADLHAKAFLFGYAALFFIELCAVLVNDFFDYESDRINQNTSPFAGGSHVLVNGDLTFGEMKTGIGLSLGLVLLFWVALAFATHHIPSRLIALLFTAGLVLAVGYTAPPLKFGYRGLGEILVAFMHGPFMIVCGYAFQSGTALDLWPWLLGIPLFLSMLPAIILAGIPDRLADHFAGKRTLAVLLGPAKAAKLASWLASLAILAALFQWGYPHIGRTFIAGMLLPLPNAILLLSALATLVRSNHFDRRIDGILALALAYIFWFGLIPLASLVKWFLQLR